jgi:hypothetical protein
MSTTTKIKSAITLKMFSVMDGEFMRATLSVDDGTTRKNLALEGEMPIVNTVPYIEDAKWAFSQNSAMAFVGENLFEINNLLSVFIIQHQADERNS